MRETLCSGYIGEGEKVRAFEEKFAQGLGWGTRVLAVNSCTSALSLAFHLLHQELGECEVLTTPLTCLHYDTKIKLSDGKCMKIGRVVNKRMPVVVSTLNTENHRAENKRVINWYKSPIGDRYFLRVTHRYANECKIHRGKKVGTVVTNDHQFYTADGYKRADALTTKDLVATSFRSLNAKQRAFLAGCMLGDGHVQVKSGRRCLRGIFVCFHTIKNEDVVLLKRAALHGMDCNIYYRPERKKTKPSKGIRAASNPYWGTVRKVFYRRKRKIVPRKYLEENLSDITLATWFIDDGAKLNNAVVLCTDCFTRSENTYLCRLLKERYGITAILQKRGNRYRIYIGNGNDNHESAKKFWRVVAPYVPSSMRSKLPDDIDNKYPFDPEKWDLGESEVFFCKVDKEVIKFKRKVKYVYCVDVEDNHNFVTGELLAHNCFATTAAIINSGLRPKWVDIDPLTFNMDIEDLERKITDSTKILCLVHFAGRPVDVESMQRIGWSKRPVSVVEDRAQAFGSTLPHSYTYACYSFQAVKTLTTGDGGMLVTMSSRYEQAKRLRWFGLDRDLPRNQDVKEVGFKYQMNDVAATLGLANYTDALFAVEQQKENARFYCEQLGIPVPPYHDGCAYPFFPLMVERRDDFIRYLAEHGIESTPAHYRNDSHSCVRQYQTPLPGMDRVEKAMTCIPCGWWIHNVAREYIVDVINKGW